MRGLPGPLPVGEKLLWQGAPDARLLARGVFRTRALALYFIALVVLAAATAGLDRALLVAGLGLVPLLLAYGYAVAVARTTTYSITDRRVVMQIGLAFPVALNLPLGKIASVDLRAGAAGGDLSVRLDGADRFAFAVLWPHARPWRFSPAEPTMRALRDTAPPAALLARLLSPAPAEQPVRLAA